MGDLSIFDMAYLRGDISAWQWFEYSILIPTGILAVLFVSHYIYDNWDYIKAKVKRMFRRKKA